MHSFSQQIKIKLWDICLSEKFLNNWSEEIQRNAMVLLASLDFSPNTRRGCNAVWSPGDTEHGPGQPVLQFRFLGELLLASGFKVQHGRQGTGNR